MCLNPVVSENLVTGKVKDRFCDMMRRTYGKCGPEGKYWEADRKSTRLNSSHLKLSRMPSSA